MELKKILTKFAFLSIIVFVLTMILVSAQSVSELRQDWLDSKATSLEARQDYRTAQNELRRYNTDENREAAVEAGKASLHAALNEAEAWLKVKQAEIEANENINEERKEGIQEDIEENFQKINMLRSEVDSIENHADLLSKYIIMIREYKNLVSDVSRNTGLIWTDRFDNHIEKLENYESRLREAAEGLEVEEEVNEKLDIAKRNIESAKEEIMKAEEIYDQINEERTPLVRFSEGNQHLRLAKSYLITASKEIKESLRLILGEIKGR